jgi:transposase-like protein
VENSKKERRNYYREFKAEAAAGGLPSFPGHGRPRDRESARLRKEIKVLREAGEILKKVAVIFA